MAKIAYVSPHGGEYLATFPADTPAEGFAEFERALAKRNQEWVKVKIPDGHPAHDLGSLHGVAHDGENVRRFGGV